jgi:cytidylate kinase
MSKNLIVAIDGSAGSGKSTSAKLVASRLNYLYIDTGAMYRAITFLAIKNKILNDEKLIISLAEESEIKLEFVDSETKVFVNDEDLTGNIRTVEVNSHVSDVSKIREVRKIMVDKQREMGGKGNGVVMEGRDITTVVFPNADVKIFLTALLDERASRRAKEFAENGTEVKLDDIKNNLIERDRIDSSREVSPLTQAPDAIVVDTTKYTIDEQVNIILEAVKKTADEKGIKLNYN